MYLQLLTVCLLVLVGTFVYFQILRPLIRSIPLFPFFSKREKVEGEIEQEIETAAVQKKENKLNELKEKRQQDDAKKG